MPLVYPKHRNPPHRRETIFVTLPPVTLLSNTAPIVAGSFVIRAASGRAFVEGGFLRNLSSSALAHGDNGGLRLTLADETWSDAMYSDAVVRAALLSGLTSSTSSEHGWNVEVLPKLDEAAIVIATSQHIEFKLPVVPSYNLFEPEQLLWVVPAVCVRSKNTITASPHFQVAPRAAAASLSAPAFEALNVDEKIVSTTLYGQRPVLNISIFGDTFHPSVGNATDVDGRTEALLRGVL